MAKKTYRETFSKYKKEIYKSPMYWVGLIFLFIGVFVSLSVIGVVVGIPMMIVGVVIMIVVKRRMANKRVG